MNGAVFTATNKTPHPMKSPLFRPSRRSFLKGLTVTTAGGIILPNILIRADDTPASRKLAVAAIGCGGKGASDLEGSSKGNEVVALCDVDEKTLASAAQKYPNAKLFRDFRKMLDEVKEIEAVTVSTPDHAHYPAAMHAIALGKHVCVQKPLTNTLWEARELHKAAKWKGVITQMGNQGHTYDDNRVVKEWIAAGVIGKVKEVHVWTNRPIWPQGKDVSFKPGDVPANLDWDLWLAATPEHAYSPDIHPFKWRGFLEWGAGAFGDMGCHLIDAASWALDLGVPRYVTASQVDEITDIAWPKGSVVKMEFPDVKGHGDVTLTWYEGKKSDGSPYLPQFPESIDLNEAFADKDPEKGGQTLGRRLVHRRQRRRDFQQERPGERSADLAESPARSGAGQPGCQDPGAQPQGRQSAGRMDAGHQEWPTVPIHVAVRLLRAAHRTHPRRRSLHAFRRKANRVGPEETRGRWLARSRSLHQTRRLPQGLGVFQRQGLAR